MDKKFSEKKIFLTILILVVLLGVAAALQKMFPSLENSLRSNILDTQTPSSVPTFSYATTTISTPNGTIVVQIADTTDKQIQGLSDRTSLPQGTGMIFVFDNPGQQYMWMKDMNFPLDMVWLDQNKKITHIATDAAPDSYRKNPPEIFYSPTSASYVIELPEGDATRLGLFVGLLLPFETRQ